MAKLREKLMHIQTEIKAPKNLYNSFGKYTYRNAEGICEAVKPYLAEEKCALVLKDRVTEVGERVYVEATAILYDMESDEKIEVNAFAREELTKRGMDASQITGAASSYARKYALNGMFLLDDTKDADTDEFVKNTTKKDNQSSEKKKTNAPKIVSHTLAECMELIKHLDYESYIGSFLAMYKVSDLSQLAQEQLNDFFYRLTKAAENQEVNAENEAQPQNN